MEGVDDIGKKPLAKTKLQPSWAGVTGGEQGEQTTAGAEQLVGTIFAEKYEVIKVLGEGGMSFVYLVRHLALNKLMALKVLHTHLASRGSSQLRFQQEARAASLLNHDSIIGIHDFGVTIDGTPYLIMDYVEGTTLEHQLRTRGHLTLQEALPIFGQTCAALAHAHQHGLVHRDLKPSNIMLTPNPSGGFRVLVVDFGVAKLVSENTPNISKLTQTGEFIGSPLYMSPEQCQGRQLDARSDIYSLGCVMYETLTGQSPFEAESIFATLYRHAHDTPAPLSTVRPDLARVPSLEKIIFKTLAKDPSARYRTMQLLAADLNSIAVGRKAGVFERIGNFFELLKVKGQASRAAVVGLLLTCILVLAGYTIYAPKQLMQSLNVCPPGKIELSNEWPTFPNYVTSNISPDVFNNELVSIETAVKAAQQRYEQSPLQNAVVYADTLIKEGRIYRKSERFDDAKQMFQKAAEILEGCTQQACIQESERETELRMAYSDLAESCYRLHEWKSAEKYFQLRLQIDSKIAVERAWLFDKFKFVSAKLYQADCLYRMGDYTAVDKIFSAKGFEQATEKQPPKTQAIFHSEYASTLLHLKKFAEAAQEFKAALALWQQNENTKPQQIFAEAGLAESFDALDQPGSTKVAYSDAYALIDSLPLGKAAEKDYADVAQNYAYSLFNDSSPVHRSDEFFKAIQIYGKAKRLRELAAT